MIETVALDADDTLWHNENIFRRTQAEFRTLLAQYHDEAWIDERLYRTEMQNLEHYGYGVKSFVLSMVETAVELTEGRVEGVEVLRLLELGREMLTAPIELLDGVADSLDALAGTFELMLITKGDLLDQESKLERSGLRDRFRHIEIVSRKDRRTYDRILARHDLRPDRFVMVGDSVRSDVLPVLELGGWAVHIPYPTPWEHETTAQAPDGERFLHLASIRELPDAVRTLGVPATDR